MPCLEHLAQLRERKDEFDRLTAEVLVVSFEPIERASMFAQEEGIPFTVVSDLQRVAYRHFGFGRSRLRPWSPLAVFAYLRAAFSGRRVRLPRARVSQFGGDVGSTPMAGSSSCTEARTRGTGRQRMSSLRSS